jgi:hypothetical protein
MLVFLTRIQKYSFDLFLMHSCAYTIFCMGTSMGGYYAKDAKREFRRRRLRVLVYVGLSLLASVTAFVVGIALGR